MISKEGILEGDFLKDIKGRTSSESVLHESDANGCWKSNVSAETFFFLIILIAVFGGIGSKMGGVNMLNTMMNTAYELLMGTVFYIMAIAVIAGAFGTLLSEFGFVAVINKLLSPLMKPLYGLPGASITGIVTTYLSDNPAILVLADDKGFRGYFKKYQLPALTNIGTAFGMGLIVTTFMMGLKSPTGESFISAALIGNLGAVIGSIVSVRIMLLKTKKIYGTEVWADETSDGKSNNLERRPVRPGNAGKRCIDAMLEGGKNGVSMGLSIIPGVVIICTFVMLLTNGAGANGEYTGSAYEGIALLPYLAEKVQYILAALFGFSSFEAVAVPITALGSAGAAIGLVPKMVESGLVAGNDIAVITAMCMCWSGYLSTHVAMMDSMKFRNLTGRAILSHTIGGICAGVSAHYIYLIINML